MWCSGGTAFMHVKDAATYAISTYATCNIRTCSSKWDRELHNWNLRMQWRMQWRREMYKWNLRMQWRRNMCTSKDHAHTPWDTIRVGIPATIVQSCPEYCTIAMFAMCVFVYTRLRCRSKTNAHDAAKPPPLIPTHPPLMSHREKKKYNRKAMKFANAIIKSIGFTQAAAVFRDFKYNRKAIVIQCAFRVRKAKEEARRRKAAIAAIQCALRVRKAKEEARRRRLDKVANTAQCILNIRRMNAEGNGILLKLQDITTALEKKLRP